MYIDLKKLYIQDTYVVGNNKYIFQKLHIIILAKAFINFKCQLVQQKTYKTIKLQMY